jgi:hypothetical protein
MKFSLAHLRTAAQERSIHRQHLPGAADGSTHLHSRKQFNRA